MKILLILIFLYLFELYDSEGCSFYAKKDDPVSFTNCSYPKHEEEEKGEEGIKKYIQKCFAMSNNDAQPDKLCCYSKTNLMCEKSNDPPEDSNLECPKKTIEGAENNCGMSGIYQPLEASACKEISLVDGYCCFTTFKKKNSEETSYSCIKTKKLEKDINAPSKEIIDYLGEGFKAEKVDCEGTMIKYFKVFFILFSVILM